MLKTNNSVVLQSTTKSKTYQRFLKIFLMVGIVLSISIVKPDSAMGQQQQIPVSVNISQDCLASCNNMTYSLVNIGAAPYYNPNAVASRINDYTFVVGEGNSDYYAFYNLNGCSVKNNVNKVFSSNPTVTTKSPGITSSTHVYNTHIGGTLAKQIPYTAESCYKCYAQQSDFANNTAKQICAAEESIIYECEKTCNNASINVSDVIDAIPASIIQSIALQYFKNIPPLEFASKVIESIEAVDTQAIYDVNRIYE
ncbi:MAG: hypothetical protein LBU68_00350 [Rickettsiales bacterium]|jgi:hypothetical protein|nr:hypothetical protein [Rickettsiales bacterium]